MGLKQDLVKARIEALKAAGVPEDKIKTGPGTPIDVEMGLTRDAIVRFILKADFKITDLNCPIILEDLKTPDQPVNVKIETLLGEYGPMLMALRRIGSMIPGVGSVVKKLINELESKIKDAMEPLLEGGADLQGLDLHKGAGKLESTGYAYVGEDPESQDAFDVSDVGGQRTFTKVKLIKDDIGHLI